MEIRIFNNYEELSKCAANEIIKQVKTNPTSTIGFATGSSPIGLYKCLIKDHKENGTDYTEIRSFNLDEYYDIEKSNPQSYFNFMYENLFSHINIRNKNINIPSGHSKDMNEEVYKYNQLLKENSLDIQILGIGSNGHIGFNEPGTKHDQETHVIELDQQTREDNARFFNSIDEVPTHAITMGIKNILDTKKIILIATGKKKAEAIKGMVNGAITEDLPASALQNHDNVILFLDKEASRYL